jgi:hypothetical protein
MISSILSMPLDKVYIFSSYKLDEKDNKKYILKGSIEKTIDISDSSFAFIEGVKSLTINEDDKTTQDFKIRELYYDKYFLQDLFNLRLGRNIKTFDFTNTYSIVNFLSISNNVGDLDDRTLNQTPLDGFSWSINDITNEQVNQYLAFHFYSEDISNKNKRSNQRYLFEMTQSGDKFHQSIFIYKPSSGDSSIAIAKSETIGEEIIYNATIRYDFGDDSAFSSVMGLEYSPTSNLLIGLESITLGNKISGRFDRIKKYKEIQNNALNGHNLKELNNNQINNIVKNAINNYYNNLTSKNYLSLYSQYSWDDIKIIFSWLENLNDSSRRLITQVNYKLQSIDMNLQATNFSGRKDTEFGFVEDKKAYEVRFFISYLLVD